MNDLYADLQRLLGFSHRACPKNIIWALVRHAANPRFMPVVLLRASLGSYRMGFRMLARFLSLINFIIFGLEVSTQCTIGPGLVLPHTVGTVIGARRIGRNALIYHQVTLGAKTMDIEYDPASRPIVGDNVIIGSGAKVLGGIMIADGVIIGANAVVVQSMPENVVVGGVPARVLRVRDAVAAENT
jgi:serine O-acetyltransferase